MALNRRNDINLEMLEDTLMSIGRGFYEYEDKKIELKLTKDMMIENVVYLPEELDDMEILAQELESNCVFDCKNMDSYSAARELSALCDDKVLVLNLANPVNPGGGVRRGAKAQEEDLCRKSTLLVSLESESARKYYEYNKSLKTYNGSNGVIITPNVEILKDEKGNYLEESVVVSAMTCAAPQLNFVKNGLTADKYYDLMYSRIEGMLKVAANSGYKHLVLGAFGCGAFNNDANVVSDIFWDVFDDLGNLFEKVIFAVLDKDSKQYNFNHFYRNFGGENFYAEDDPELSTKKKKKDLDNELKNVLDHYNITYTELNDLGTQLFYERERCGDVLELVETLVNSIANSPKSFATDIEEIRFNKESFKEKTEYAKQELQKARETVTVSGAGMAAGAAIASVAPTAAMWVATTFGTVSTGTAISALSGAAAQSAALAWLGGGALTAGGGGMAAGTAFLAMAGPVGWGIAGASVLTSVVLFANSKLKAKKEKHEEILAVNNNIEMLRETIKTISSLKQQHEELRISLYKQFKQCMKLNGRDFESIDKENQKLLDALVNNAKALSFLMRKGIE